MLKDIEELIKRRKLTTLALHMTEYSREPAPVPLLAKTKHAVAATTTTAAAASAAAEEASTYETMATMASLALATATAAAATTTITTTPNTIGEGSNSTTPPITPPTPPPLNMSRTQPLTPSGLLAAATPTHTPTHGGSNSSAINNTPPATNTNLTAHTPLLGHSSGGRAPSTTSTPPAAGALTGATINPCTNTLQDHYSLRWNNHQNHILRAFDALLQTKTLVDVTLVCAETSIRAHKMVLSACSPFFQRVFAETPCKHPVIVLKDFRGWVVQAIVDFMYRGEISVPQERLQTLIQAGESLQVRGLVESSVPEHTPTPAASPDDFGMLHESSLMSSELERCSSFDDEALPSMVTPAGSKLIIPSRLFGAATSISATPTPSASMTHMRRTHERKRERELEERERDRELAESDQELQGADLCTSPMPRRKQARPRRRSGEMPHDFQDLPETSLTATTPTSALGVNMIRREPRSADASPESRHKIGDAETSAAIAAAAAAAANNSDDVQRELSDLHAQQLAALQTVIKSELVDPMDDDEEDEADRDDIEHEHELGRHNDTESGMERDSGTGNDSHEHNESQEHKTHDLSHKSEAIDEQKCEQNNTMDDSDQEDLHNNAATPGGIGDEDEDIEELINNTNDLRRKAVQSPCNSDGPEDLCTTKKDNHNDTSGHHSTSASDNECSPANNNNNSSKLKDNNQRIVLSLKDIRHLNKPSSSSTPNSSSNHPFAPPCLRDLRMDHASDSPCNMDALEAQMHAAAAAAVAAASAGAENPFQHMEHQMDLSLAAAAAAAAVSHQHSRERDHVMREREREHRELQHQHNAFANSLLGPMGMPPFGPGGGGCGPNGPNGGPLGGQAPHERLEESMNRLSKEFGKEFAPSSPMSLPSHFNPPDGPPHPPSPLPFPGMSSALTLTPPHMFGLDSPLGLFPPGIDPGKLYNPLMEMSDPRDMPGGPPPFLKKKMPRPKGQHSAPRGGPPRSWTNSELTEALQHVWNKKMTTSQASRIFGIPYNSLLMYVRGKYGKSLKLEQLRKDCISGPPLEMLQMGISSNSGSSKSEKHKERKEREKDKSGGGGSGREGGGGAGGGGPGANGGDNGPPGLPLELELGLAMPGGGPPGGPRSGSSEPDLLGGPNSLFNPFNPQGFYPDFPGGFPGLPLSMLNLLPPSERHQHAAAAAAMHHMSAAGLDEDCKSDRSKQSSSLDDDFPGPLALNREEHHRRSSEMLAAAAAAANANPNGSLSHANGGSGGGQD